MPEHDLVGILSTLLATFGDRVHAVADDEWDLRTPCAAWRVADVVAHLIGEHRWVEPLLQGLELEDAATEVDAASSFVGCDGVGETYAQAWDEAAKSSQAAFSEPDALDRTVSLSRGASASHGYVRELIFDLTIHSWDLQRAIGYSAPLPADVVQIVWDESERFGDLSASGLFDVPVSVADEAPALDRLIALTGRDPGWTPPA